MTNDELNRYIKHYIEKDRTGRAIMLTGAWGVGKSYYIKNILVPFLACPENGEHKCIVVSLYGLSNLSEVSKAIYLEARAKMLNPESEAGKTTLLVAKTVLKGLASHFGFDLNTAEDDLQKLYKSIDLSGKLIILEDVERTEINILKLLGYINSLAEQDGVKVLLVTNEKEILKYQSVKKDASEKENKTGALVSLIQAEAATQTKEFTEETLRYLEIKEKSIGDTICYVGDLKEAVKEIIQSFDSEIMQRFAKDQNASDIVDIMGMLKSENLRSVIFACQKATDIYEFVPQDETISNDFLQTILYGVVAFSMRLNSGNPSKWVGLEYYSLDLGINNYPLFRFCFDYIVDHRIDPTLITHSVTALEKMRLYDRNKTIADPDLQIINGYYMHTENEVNQAVMNITRRLHNPEDISFYDYGRIAVALIIVKHNLGIEVDVAKELLIKNLCGRSGDLDENDIFWYTLGESSQEAKEEYVQLRKDMLSSFSAKTSAVPGFDYSPEKITTLYEYIINNIGKIYNDHGFAKYLDIPRFVDMFAKSTPAEMDKARAAFLALYRTGNIKDFLAEDLSAIEELLDGIEKTWERPGVDKVQLLQYRWFIDNLKEIRKKLS